MNHFDVALKSLKRCFQNELYDYSITVLDVRDYFGQADHLSQFIQKYPNVKIFLPAQKMGVEEAINLYIHESKADFMFFLSSDLYLMNFSMSPIIKTFQSDNRVVGVVPKVLSDERTVSSVYQISDLKKGPYISYENYHFRVRTLLPYKFSFFFDGDVLRSLIGLDGDFHNFFFSLLDHGYRLYSQGHYISGCEGFEVVQAFDVEVDFDEVLRTDKLSRFLFKCFSLKNLSYDNMNFDVFRTQWFFFLSFQFDLLKSFRLFKQKRSAQDSLRIFSDDAILNLLREKD